MNALRRLITELIDYAGLFPPSALDMPAAAANYAAYQQGEFAWALGRFVVPVARLAELEAALPADPAPKSWRLSALAGADLEADLAAICGFNDQHRGAVRIDSIEGKASTPAEIEAAMRLVPRSLTPYFEIPVAKDPSALIEAIGAAGARAKIRTGGITPEMFPPAQDVARFLVVCARHRVAFKATAGLHHPFRCLKPLTYEPDSETGWMYGFLNVFVAAALVRHGLPAIEAVSLLEDHLPESFRIEVAGIAWRSRHVTTEQIAQVRRDFAISFGSCSFDEPIADLHHLHLL